MAWLSCGARRDGIEHDWTRRHGARAGLLGVVVLAMATGSALLSAREPSGPNQSVAQVREIDRQVAEVWKAYSLRPSSPAPDGEWCRRVYLDILGRIPTVDELERFLASRGRDKRRKLVRRLLYDEEYTEEYARNWTTLWTNILIGRSGGLERRTLISRPGMQKYLRDSFARNKPYDRMVYELVTATGTTAPGSPKFNGAVNFLIEKVNMDKAAQATASVARLFLGMQVQCTQCHNHPFNSWKQRKFWEFNAFLRQTRALRQFEAGTRNIAYAELVDQDFAGEGSSPEEAEIYYELRNGLLKAAYPVFLDGTEIRKSGLLKDVNRREELGKLILGSPYMSRAMVNRMWAHFMGYGFTKPIDDMGPHNSPTHPELLDFLSEEFKRNSYDIKRLIEWIVLSRPYGLSSATNSTNEKVDDPLLGETPKFSRFYMRQMRAEELYESLVVATAAQQTRGNYAEQERVKAQWLRQFIIAFGNDEGTEMTTFNGTIPQVLMMFNGDLIRRATSMKGGSMLAQVIQSKQKSTKKIEHLYLAALARKPTRNELTMANQLLRVYKGDAAKALQDIWWVLLNSNEFIFNH